MVPTRLWPILVWMLPLAQSNFEICNPGKDEHVYRFTSGNCPSGVLFAYPVTAGCMASSYSTDYYISDLCDQENFLFDQDAAPYKVHLAFGEGSSLEIDPDSSCASWKYPDRCNTSEVTIADATNFQEPERRDPCSADYLDLLLTEEEASRRKDPQVVNQTERVFKYLTGLLEDTREDNPKSRIVIILEQSFEVLKIYSSSDFIPSLFLDDILKAFLYVHRDSDSDTLIDIPPEDFRLVHGELEKCKKVSKSPFKVVGQICRNCSFAYAIEKGNQTMRYLESETSFAWGRHDVILDAIWSVLSFTHGLCYGTFKLRFHELFTRAAEMLFNAKLQYRWIRPPELYFEELWDHMFSAPVRTTMRNLDVFVTAAYASDVPLHRLERPILPEMPKKEQQRKRRGLPTMNIDKGGLNMAGWCFQSRRDLFATASAYVNMHCPGVRKPLEHLVNFVLEEMEASASVSPTSDNDDNDLEARSGVQSISGSEKNITGGDGDGDGGVGSGKGSRVSSDLGFSPKNRGKGGKVN